MMGGPTRAYSWSYFYAHCRADIKLWCYFVFLQQICRLYYIGVLHSYLDPDTDLYTVLFAMAHGLRFDLLWATSWLFLPLIFLTLPTLVSAVLGTRPPSRRTSPLAEVKRVYIYRAYIGYLFTGSTAFIYIAYVEYYREFRNIFGQFLFEWLYDDRIAILKTIYSEHNPFQNLIFLISVTAIYGLLTHLIIRNINSVDTWRSANYSPTFIAISIVAITCFYVISFRGGIGPRPIQRKDAAVTTDPFLNKAVISPYSSLKYAVREHLDIRRSSRDSASISPADLQSAAQRLFQTDQQFSTLTQYLQRTTEGSPSLRPRHVFLIVGESLDAWPLSDEFRELELTRNLRRIAEDGIHFKYFLPSSQRTMSSLNTLISGIPDMGLHINFRKRSRTPYPTALAIQFKQLGFRPRLFYGGYLSWQNLEVFSRSQGFEEVFGAAHISSWMQTNQWGVDDRSLFDFVVKSIQDTDSPTFNLIVTTSNHPPFSIELNKEGFQEAAFSRPILREPPSRRLMTELGHIWYADKAIGEFIRRIEAVDSTALVAITGDHYGRRHILPNPPLFDTSAVPLIIRAPGIKEYCKTRPCQQPDLTAGSHLDIGATLIELVAPPGFTYFSMGNNLLAEKGFSFGLGQSRLITTAYVATVDTEEISFHENSQASVATSSGPPAPQLEELLDRHELARIIAGYLVEKGDGLHQPPDETH